MTTERERDEITIRATGDSTGSINRYVERFYSASSRGALMRDRVDRRFHFALWCLAIPAIAINVIAPNSALSYAALAAQVTGSLGLLVGAHWVARGVG